jgi:hypothetical protein
MSLIPHLFMGVFAKLRRLWLCRACLPIHMEQLDSSWMNIHEIFYCVCVYGGEREEGLLKLGSKNQVWLNICGYLS